MPILQMFCPPDDGMTERLRDACVAVAGALALPTDGVIATHVPTSTTVRQGHPAADQVVVVVHSSARDEAAVERARAALQALADSWTTGEPAWISWQARP